MNELIKKRVKENKGKEVLIFLHNNFRYEGKLTDADDRCLEILDFKSKSYHIIEFSEIKQIEVKE